MRFFRGHRQFLRLWAAQTVSSFGGAITAVAMPLTAVTVFAASPLEMGVLSAFTVLPQLLFSLVAGVWVDRLSRRFILIFADGMRAGVLGLVPVLATLNWLRLEHLYAVTFLAGILTLLADSSALALVPALVGRDELVRANSATMFSLSVAGSAGPSVAGGLAQALGAPFAIAVNAGASLVAAFCGLSIEDVETRGTRRRGRLRTEVAEGMRELFRTSLVSALVISATIGAFAGALQGPVLILYFVGELHMAPVVVGTAVTAVGAASVVGALAVPALSRWLGHGRVYIAGQVAAGVGGFVVVAADGPGIGSVLVVIFGQLVLGFGAPLYVIQQRVIRQALTPDHLLGRVTATWRFFVYGAQSLGAVLGGALGAGVGLRPALVGGSVGLFAGAGWAACSPLRSLRRLPQALP